jgi:osmotically-inducible protein OsmY
MRFPVLAASLLVSGTLLAQGADFTVLDRNRDGFLSRIEALGDAEIYKRFGQFDTDGDKQLSLAEHTAALDDNNLRIQRDAALSERVKAALVAERAIRASAISVETYEGEVQLSGFVPAADMASRAGRVTAGVDGVRFVHNNLLVKVK